jgi:hypothetical protein
MIDIKSGIRFGSSANFPSGRALGQNIGGGGTPQSIANKVKKNVKQVFTQYINTGKFVDEMAEVAIERIKKRTIKRGTDVNGKPFEPYTTAYQKWKARQGKYRGKTDLYLTGQMLNAIYFKRVTNLTGVIRIKNSSRSAGLSGKAGNITNERLAAIHNEGKGKMPKRSFFHWRRGSQDDRKLGQTAIARVKRAQRQLARGGGISPRSIGTTLA